MIAVLAMSLGFAQSPTPPVPSYNMRNLILHDGRRPLVEVNFVHGRCRLGESEAEMIRSWSGPPPPWDVGGRGEVGLRIYFDSLMFKDSGNPQSLILRHPRRVWGAHEDGLIAHYLTQSCELLDHDGAAWVRTLEGANRHGRSMLTRLLWHELVTRSSCSTRAHERALRKCWKTGRCSSAGETVDAFRDAECGNFSDWRTPTP